MAEDETTRMARENRERLVHAEDILARHDEQLDRGSKIMEENAKQIRDMITLFGGNFGRDGLVKDVEDLKHRTKAQEDWKRDIKGFVAGAIFVSGLIGSSVAGFVVWLVQKFL